MRNGRVEQPRQQFLQFGQLLLVGAIACALLLGACAKPRAAATLTIDGQTYTLAHARAWKNGQTMNIVSNIDLVFAEAPLASVEWASSNTAYASGTHGRVLRIALSQSAEDFRRSLDKGPPYRFRLDEGYSVSVAVPEHDDGELRRLEPSIPGADITADNDWLRGELSWSGSLTLTDDGTERTLTAITATFSLPLEDVQPR